MQQQMMQKAMMGQGPGNTGQGPRTMAAGGGRIGYAEGTPGGFKQFMKEREQMHREGGKQNILRDWERYKRFKKYGKTSVQEAADRGYHENWIQKRQRHEPKRTSMKLSSRICSASCCRKIF